MDLMTTMDVLQMTLAEEGGFFRLLNFDWLNDGLRDDDDYLSHLSRLEDAWFNGGSQKIRPLFAPVRSRPGYVTSIMLQRLRDEYAEFVSQKREAGKISGSKRKGQSEFMRQLALKRHANGGANDPANGLRTTCEPSLSPSVTNKKNPVQGDSLENLTSGDVKNPTLEQVSERDFTALLQTTTRWEPLARGQFARPHQRRVKVWIVCVASLALDRI